MRHPTQAWGSHGGASDQLGMHTEKNTGKVNYLMGQLQIICLLRPGTQERWRRFYQTVEGSRRDQFEASCQQAGITQVQVRLAQLLHGELLLITLTTQEPQQTLQDLPTSHGQFECSLPAQFPALLAWNTQTTLPSPPCAPNSPSA